MLPTKRCGAPFAVLSAVLLDTSYIHVVKHRGWVSVGRFGQGVPVVVLFMSLFVCLKGEY